MLLQVFLCWDFLCAHCTVIDCACTEVELKCCVSLLSSTSLICLQKCSFLPRLGFTLFLLLWCYLPKLFFWHLPKPLFVMSASWILSLYFQFMILASSIFLIRLLSPPLYCMASGLAVPTNLRPFPHMFWHKGNTKNKLVREHHMTILKS